MLGERFHNRAKEGDFLLRHDLLRVFYDIEHFLDKPPRRIPLPHAMSNFCMNQCIEGMRQAIREKFLCFLSASRPHQQPRMVMAAVQLWRGAQTMRDSAMFLPD
jgi:hypothetical protein